VACNDICMQSATKIVDTPGQEMRRWLCKPQCRIEPALTLWESIFPVNTISMLLFVHD
jgi:hypothetical protein